MFLLRTILAILIFVAPNTATADQCPDLFKMLGLFTHSSFVCDKRWLNRPSFKKVGDAIHDAGGCKGISSDDAQVYLHMGYAQFDQDSKEKGLMNACIGMDEFMKALDAPIN